jgi:hypothetical protein
VNDNPNQKEMIRSWLDLDLLPAPSAKGLFRSVTLGEGLNQPDWSVVKTRGEDRYLIAWAVVDATFRKLGVPIESDLNDDCNVVLPVTPGFPFFLAVAALYWEMKNDADFHPPQSVRFFFDGMEMTGRIEIDLETTAKDGSDVDFEKFSNAWRNRAGHKTIARMNDVARSAVDVNFVRLNSALSRELVESGINVQPFFSGFAKDVVSLRIENPSIIIEWTIA